MRLSFRHHHRATPADPDASSALPPLPPLPPPADGTPPGREANAHASPSDAPDPFDPYADPFVRPGFGAPLEREAEPPPRSLFGEILDWMLAPLLLLWPMSIAVTYLVAKSIANGPFDRALETNTYVLAQQVHSDRGQVTLTLPMPARDLLRADATDNVYFQVLGAKGELVAGTAELPLPHEDERAQPGVVQFRDENLGGNDIRVAFTYVDLPRMAPPGSMALVQVAETLDKRSQLANEIIKGVILPQFVILPLAIVLVWFGLSRGLAPLHALQEHIRARRPDDLSPLEARQAPPEIAPLVGSLNDLLGRLEQNMKLQQRFIADAAHQLKTPLAGLRMQAELALRQTSPDELRRSLSQIAVSSEQAARLVNQLLALARAENSANDAAAFTPVNLSVLARSAMQDWFQAAFAKRIDLGFEEPPFPVHLSGQPVMLRELLNNLIDNAIRYTPPGGKVTVRLRHEASDGFVHLEVEDTGPGIPVSERPRVFERFYRILGSDSDGSGLGLAIVREIVQIHRGDVSVLDHVDAQHPEATGTLIRVTLPLADAPIENPHA